MTTSTPALTDLDGTWRVDVLHSHVGFVVRHMVVTRFRAGFAEPAAQLTVADGRPVLTGSAPVSSLTITQPDFRSVLMSPEWFAAEQHPDIRFGSTSMQVAGDGTLTLDGELTVKGITRPVAGRGRIGAPVIDLQGNRRLALELEGAVDRREFGLGWNATLPGGRPAVAADVTLVVELALVEA
jgi:polyisoprenoid-binding protein YceI